MYALLLVSILETLSVFALSALLARSPGQPSMGAGILSLALAQAYATAGSFLTWFVLATFQFGFSIMLLQFCRRKHANLGYILLGFKKINPAGKITAAIAAFLAALSLIARILANVVFARVDFSALKESLSLAVAEVSKDAPIMFRAENIDALITTAIASLFLAIFALLTLPHLIFVFHLHFDNPEMRTAALFRKSACLMRGKVFLLVRFALRAGGKPLLVAFVLAALAAVIPGGKNAPVSLLVFILDIAYFINFYTAIIRIHLTVPVLYDEIVSPTKEA